MELKTAFRSWLFRWLLPFFILVSTGRTPATVWSTEWTSRTSGFTVLKMNRKTRRDRRGILTSGWPLSWPGLSLFVWCVFGEQTCFTSVHSWWLEHKKRRIKCFNSHAWMHDTSVSLRTLILLPSYALILILTPLEDVNVRRGICVSTGRY